MEMISQVYHMVLAGAMIVLAVLIIVSMIRSVLGPGISDRIIAVNMTGTMIIMIIAVLSVYLDENYLVDVCLIYAMISFLGVVVLCKVYTGVYLQRKHMSANLKAIDDNLHHQEDEVVEMDAQAGAGGAAKAGTGGLPEAGTGAAKAGTRGLPEAGTGAAKAGTGVTAGNKGKGM